MKKIVLICIVLFSVIASPAYANRTINVIEMTGDIFSGQPYINPSNNNVYTIDFSGTRAIEITREEYDENFDQLITSRTTNAYDDGQPYATGTNFTIRPHNVGYITTVRDGSGNQIGRIRVVITSGNNYNDIFSTPGWNQYMGRVNDIFNAIPPAPNWQQVANTFRDTIVPSFRNEMEDMLGQVPNAPPPPNYNNNLSGQIDAPTGQEASGLADASFGANDIKSAADPIEVREDPTGGFTIMDPVGSLPSQEEFRDNIPNEGEMVAPDVPETDAEAPQVPDVDAVAPGAPEEQENIAPTPPEVGGVAPSPGEVEGTAPNPNEGENIAPGAPSEGNNIPPTPPSDSTTAPIPGEGDNIAPNPGEGGGSAPIPGADGSVAPIP